MMPKNESEKRENNSFKFYGYFGIAVIVVAEVLLFLKVPLIGVYFTPIVWTGYILFIDAVIYRYRGSSYITSRRRELAIMLPWSVISWFIFEGYNLFMTNWKYYNLPDNLFLRWTGYIWSFATIFPAILETAELIDLTGVFRKVKISKFIPSARGLKITFLTGLIFLVFPFLVSTAVARYLFVLVWFGFIFLLEPINFSIGGRSIIHRLRKGNVDIILNLFAAGLICGILWEFWNYWADTKWKYDVPLPLGFRVFEMPILGYLGFLPFAVECYSMQNFIMVVKDKFFNRV
ncbi:MAG: hypothetical protein ACE5QV_05390 [Fidelibacterota bacterium]